MESVLSRYRNLIVLVLVLFLQVLGLAVQVKTRARENQDTRLIRIWAIGVVTPFERAMLWVQNSSGNLWHNYFFLRGVRAENRQLKEQIEQMRLEQVRLSEDAAQAHRLQMLLAFKEQFISKTVAAQVIGTSGSDLSRVIYIDKGEDAGIRRDMAVMTADGIVGKVLLAYPNMAQVLLISDQSSGVGAILEKSRLQGVIRGTANGEVVLERVMSDEQVQPGETVLTSGGDQIFPKGLPVGIVTKVSNGKDLFLNIKIKPAANLGKLEEVLVLTEQQERQAVAEEHGRVRAADILAQRLPSVPDKPATEAPGTSVAAGGSTKPATAATNSASKPAGIATPSTMKPANAIGAPKSASPKAAGAAAATAAGGSKITATDGAPKPVGTPANTPAGAIKNTLGNSPNSARSPAAVSAEPAKAASPAPDAQKPRPVNNSPIEQKTEGVPAAPSIVEQKPTAPKPVPADQPATTPPPQDNSPQ